MTEKTYGEKVEEWKNYFAKTDKTRKELETIAIEEPCRVDGLWKADFERLTKSKEKAFPITTYSSFYRPEILDYLDKLHTFRTEKKKCLIIPCSEIKPFYKNPWHRRVTEITPKDYLVTVVSGTLGVIPQTLWEEMPYYDAGIPNFNRVDEELTKFLWKNKFDKIVVEDDFYALTIMKVLAKIPYNTEIVFVEPINYRTDYGPLDLKKLEEVFKDEIRRT